MRIINTALCSFGMSGLVFHAPFIEAHPGLNLYGVFERSEKKAANHYASIISFDSLDSMLSDSAIELVVVNTPNYTHFEFASKCLKAGKHVLVEKAFTVTVEEAEQLIALAEKVNRLICVFQKRRYDSDFKTFRKIIAGGKLGKLVEAELHFDRYKPEPSAKKHKESILPGSGLLHDLGPHLADQAIVCFGMPASLFSSLRITRPGSVVNDYFDILLFYPGLNVRLKASLLVRESLPAYAVHGLNGSFVKSRADIQEDLLKEGAKPSTEGWGFEDPMEAGLLNINDGSHAGIEKVISEPGNYAELYDQLYKAIVFGLPVPVSGSDGLNVMKIIAAAIESDNKQQVINIT